MALSDPHGIVLLANPAYFDLYGYGREEVVGQDFAIIFPSDQRAWARAAYQAVFRGAELPSEFESTIMRRDGSLRNVRSQAAFLTENYIRTAMLSIVRDITPTDTASRSVQD